MENIYVAYWLGILSVVFFGMIAGIFSSIWRNYKHSKHLDGIERRMDDVERDIYSRFDLIERRVDSEIDRVNQLRDELNRNFHQEINQLREMHNQTIGYTDSRVDKLENKIKSTFGSVNTETK
jgi:hypothetical protein